MTLISDETRRLQEQMSPDDVERAVARLKARKCIWREADCPASCRGGNCALLKREPIGEPGSEMSAMTPQGALDAAEARVNARTARRARLSSLAQWHHLTARKLKPGALKDFHIQASADIWVELGD